MSSIKKARKVILWGGGKAARNSTTGNYVEVKSKRGWGWWT